MHNKHLNSGLLFCVLLSFISTQVISQVANGLPNVFTKNQGELIERSLRQQAIVKFSQHPLPHTIGEWNQYKASLKKKIIQETGTLIHQDLPLNIKQTGSAHMKGYSVENISFQTRPGIYATANLFIPDGDGKFPAVIVMMGHSAEGRLYDKYQAVGITLALNGYVSLCIDPWGSGERTTVHGMFEDHGDQNNLGSALLNIGESLMGMQITDNIRGVDLLCSLPYVDPQRIGATGASGGGNQTIWLTAMDERIKAAVPVVSAGTFEAYIMGSPCICEVLTDGLTFTEEDGILSLMAPRAIKMCNHSRDDIEAFNPREMLRSYHHATPVFEMLGAKNNISYDTFNLVHGYWPEDRQAMLGWFNFYLKGIGDRSPVQEISFNTIPMEQLMVFAKGKRDTQVLSTADYCKQKGNELRNIYLNTKKFDASSKRTELRNLLRMNEPSLLKKVHSYPEIDGWKRFAIETSDDKIIPVLIKATSQDVNNFVIIADAAGKQHISAALIADLIKPDVGIAVIDLSGTGEMTSTSLNSNDSIGRLRTLFKSYLWLGKTPMGEWVKELKVVTGFIKSEYKYTKINLFGIKEAGLACLFLAALNKDIQNVRLDNAPVSYLFDNREGVEFFSSAVNVPGLLNWGDVSLAAALAGQNVIYINPLTMSGRMISEEEFIKYHEEVGIMGRKIGVELKTSAGLMENKKPEIKNKE